MRDLLIYLLWRNGHHATQAAGEFSRVAPTTLPAARARGVAHLTENRELRARLKKCLAVNIQ